LRRGSSDGQGFEKPCRYIDTGTKSMGQGMDLKTCEKLILLSRVWVTLGINYKFLILYKIIIILTKLWEEMTQGGFEQQPHCTEDRAPKMGV
jgi:hypothetical protein